MKKISIFKPAAVFLALCSSFSALSQSVAITNATVFTNTDKGVLNGATIVIDDGKVVAINPSSVNADTMIDGTGKVVTPGLISAMSRLGLVEVGAVATSRDARPKKGGAGFDASLAFNPESTLIPLARKGGITQAVVAPRGTDDLFDGQVFVVDLTGDFDSVVSTENGLVAGFGATSKDSRAVSLSTLKKKLEAQREKLKKAEEKEDDKKSSGKKPSDEEVALTKLLNNEIPLVAEADRPSDILHLIKIKQEFGITMAIAHAAGAVKVKEQLAAAQIPVLIGGVDNLPGNFDGLNANLENAGKLEAAGVKVIFTIEDSHMVKNLRFDAGNAVAHGMSKEGALAAMTSNVAEFFNIDGGIINEGADADVVLWSGDPLEISTKVDKLWINGEEVSTETRQDKLRDRYTSEANVRRGYIK